MPRDLVIGIDSSTTATKAIAWDRTGAPVAEGRAAIPLAQPRPRYFEQEPEDWWRSTSLALRELTAKVEPARIAGVAISNQRETFGLFGEHGEPIRPAIVWLDERAMDQMRRFGASFGAEKIHAISGKPVDITPCLYRMVWLRENEPHLLDRAAYVAEVHGYLCFRLTGRWTTSTASADPMGVLDMERLVWSQEILAAAGVPIDKMLALVRPGAFIGTVTEAAAQATGLPADTPVFAAGGDGQCAGTGVDVLRSGRAYINLGTAVVSGSYSERYVFDAAFRTETAVADRGYIVETCLRSGTFLVDWLSRELLGIDPQREARGADRSRGRSRRLAGRRQRRHARPLLGGMHDSLLGCVGPRRDRRPLGIDPARRSLSRAAGGRGARAGAGVEAPAKRLRTDDRPLCRGGRRHGIGSVDADPGRCRGRSRPSLDEQGGVLSRRGNGGRHGMRLVPELCRGIGRHGRPYRSDLRTEAEREGGLRGTGRDIRRTLASAFELEPQARSLCRAAGCKAAILNCDERSRC